MPLLICLSLLGFCFALARFTDQKIEATPLLVISAVIVFLYFSAYCQMLLAGANVVLISGWLLLLSSPFYLKCDKTILMEKYLTPGFVFFMGFLASFLMMAHAMQFHVWDEFTHWGPHAKLILFNHGFFKPSDITIHKSYPLAGALFQFLFLHPCGYSEGNAYLAQCLLVMAPIGIFGYQKAAWRNWHFSFIALAFTVLILILLHLEIGYAITLYMDSATGIYFGMIMVAYLSSDKKITSILWLILPVCALTLFKQKLMPLVLMASYVIFVCEFIRYFQHPNSRDKRKFFAILALPLASFLITESWHHYLAKIGTKVEWKMHLTLAKLENLFFATPHSVTRMIILNYFHALIPVLYFILCILILCTASYFFYRKKQERTMLISINSVLLFGFIAYIAGLLLMYLFSFSTYEGLTHASMPRYLNIYYIGWSLVVLYFLIDSIASSQVVFSSLLKNLLVILFSIALILAYIFHQNTKSTQGLRQTAKTIAAAVKTVTPINSHTYVIWQNSNGFLKAMLIYELLPRKINLNCSCVGKPYLPDNQDPWTCNYTLPQMQERLSHFDYLLLGYADAQFWSEYGALLPARQSLKPFLTYTVCQGKGYNTFGQKGCVFEKHHAYLFKIIHKNNQLSFKNIVSAS